VVAEKVVKGLLADIRKLGPPLTYLGVGAMLADASVEKRRSFSADAVLQTQAQAAAKESILRRFSALSAVEKRSVLDSAARLEATIATASRSIARLTPQERMIAPVLLKDSSLEGADYCAALEAAGVHPRRKWRTAGCPSTYPQAYLTPKWKQRISDEKSKLAKKLLAVRNPLAS
jgi:hypothetical protein